MEKHHLQSIAGIAGQVLAGREGERLHLGVEPVFSIWKSLVVRCRLIDGPADLPKSFIVKKALADTIGYDPDHPGRPDDPPSANGGLG